MSDQEDRRIDRTIRTVAKRHGLGVRRSRKDGSYLLYDLNSNMVAAGGQNIIGCEYGLSQGQALDALTEAA